MAIQNRRGVYKDFDPDKLLPAEAAVVLGGDPNAETGESVYMCFSAGNTKRMSTYEDMQENIKLATSDIQKTLVEGLDAAVQEATASEIKKKLDNGEMTGPKGDKGDKGEKGEDGNTVVTTLPAGCFGMSVDGRGHLIMTHNDNEVAPPLSIQNGRMVYTIN